MSSELKKIPVSHVQEWKAERSVNNNYRRAAAYAILRNETEKPFQCWDYDKTMDFVQQVQSSNVTYNRCKLKAVDDYLQWLMNNLYITPEEYANHPFTVYRNSNLIETRNGKKVYGYNDDFGTSSDDKVRACYFFSVEEFKAYLDAVTPGTMWIMRRAAMILAWLGLSRDDISNLKRDDVTFIKRSEDDVSVIIKIDENVYETKDATFYKSLEYAYNTETETFLRLNPVSNVYTERTCELEDLSCGYFIRYQKRANVAGRNNAKMQINHISEFLKKQQNKLPEDSPFRDKNIALGDIRYSGIFVRVYEQYDTIIKAVKGYGMNSALANRYTLWASLKPKSEG